VLDTETFMCLLLPGESWLLAGETRRGANALITVREPSRRHYAGSETIIRLCTSVTPRGGTGRFLRCFFLRVGTDRSPQDDLAALHLDRDPTGIRLRIAHQRLLDLRLQILWYRLRLDREEIADSSDAGEAIYSWFGISLLEVMIDLAFERHPALTDRHINFVSRNRCIPPQGAQHSSGEIGIGAFGKAGQAHLEIVGDRLDTKNAVRSLLRCGLFQVRIDQTRQGNDPIFDHYPDFVGLHVCIPLQLFQHISLCIFISIETHCHMRVSFPCLSSFFIFADGTYAHCRASGPSTESRP